MADATQDLKDKTLAQLQALRTTLASPEWQIQMMSASSEQKQQSSDLRILVDARIAQLEDVQFAAIEKQIDANAAELKNAIAGVQQAVTHIQDIAKVLTAASGLLKVVGKVLATLAM